jgi:hypothetical protein
MLVLANSMQAYFREALDAAMRTSKIIVTESAQVYVVHLLNEFSRSEKVFLGFEQGERPSMAQLLERAYLANDYEALQIYRHLGDTALYLLGFFKESKKGRVVSATYYRDVGSIAYSCASDLSRAYTANCAALFDELSKRFNDMVIVLENIANYCNQHEKS